MELIKYRQNIINKRYRKKLHDTDFSLVCSNCFGGIFYHWLGMQFKSPFINLFLSNEDFIKALSHWNEFLAQPLIEDFHAGKSYPVGIGYDGIRVEFQHYTDFASANEKWEERKLRIIPDKTIFMLTNWGGVKSVVEQFDSLPLKNKIIFTDKPFPECRSAVWLKGWQHNCGRNIWLTSSIFGNRYIDQFDLIGWINRLLS